MPSNNPHTLSIRDFVGRARIPAAPPVFALTQARSLATQAEEKARAALGWTQIALTVLHRGDRMEEPGRILLADVAAMLEAEGDQLAELGHELRRLMK